MRIKLYIHFFILLPFCSSDNYKKPTILISILARNKAHTLPYFLTSLERLNYPKNRIGLWIRSDHNSDATLDILRLWISDVKNSYHSISTLFVENDNPYPNEKGPNHWTNERLNHIIELRESALNYGRDIWADYFLTIDCDVFLTNSDTINLLLEKKLAVVAPMLISEGLYSNFWHGMTADYYYTRTDGYKPIRYRQEIGCFGVPMIHSCVLIDLRQTISDRLTYLPENIEDYDGPNDDIIAFAIGANRSQTPLNLCNEHNYGYTLVPLEPEDKLDVDYEQLTNIELEILTDGGALVARELFEKYLRTRRMKDRLGFDRIFMINLARRPERRERMLKCFDVLGLDVEVYDAVDGRNLNESILEQITFLPEYTDPYHKRPMTLGEIGCFLSHFNIWKQIVENGYKQTLVLEDDIRFEPFFRQKVNRLMEEVGSRLSEWDLIYLGRKKLQENDEVWVEKSNVLVYAGYSYWTLGYILSLDGARKLLEADPLSKLLPVDEYLPILFDKHPQTEWKDHYPKRELIGLSAAQLLVYPTHYTGEDGYISDTEDSLVIKDNIIVARDDL